MRRNIIIYFLNRNREKADKLFNELVAKELLQNNSVIRLSTTYGGSYAIFEDDAQIQMHRAAESSRGLWWTSAYIDCDTDPEIIQTVLIPSGKGSKDIVYFN